MFKKEQYSREAYNKAQEGLIRESKVADSIREGAKSLREKGSVMDQKHRRISRADYLEQVKISYDIEDRAEKKLRGLLEAGHQEAIQLNEEYKRLKKQAENATNELLSFERDKLGIRNPNNI